MTTIIPQYKLVITYDVQGDKYETYYRYVLGEFVPAMRELGLYMLSAWHVAYGNYPSRQIEFICQDLHTWQSAQQSKHWEKLETRLKSYTVNYTRKLIPFEDRFQF